jgi:hypothetical protein
MMLEEKGVAQVVSLESLGRLTETPSPAINVYVLPYVRYSRHVNTLFYNNIQVWIRRLHRFISGTFEFQKRAYSSTGSTFSSFKF